MTDKEKLLRPLCWPKHPPEYQDFKLGEYPLTAGEKSGWFQWFGNYNPGEALISFEQQFCQNVNNLCPLPDEEPRLWHHRGDEEPFRIDPVAEDAARRPW